MKHVFKILSPICAITSIFYTVNYVESGDVCRTIIGCTMLLMWFLILRKDLHND